jgi:hypothetical protein
MRIKTDVASDVVTFLRKARSQGTRPVVNFTVKNAGARFKYDWLVSSSDTSTAAIRLQRSYSRFDNGLLVCSRGHNHGVAYG